MKSSSHQDYTKCRYCGKSVDTDYWKNLCQDCANKLAVYRRMTKEERIKRVLKTLDDMHIHTAWAAGYNEGKKDVEDALNVVTGKDAERFRRETGL